MVVNGINVRGEMPVAVTSVAEKGERGRAKTHLVRLTRKPLARRMSKKAVRWERCEEKSGLATKMSSR